MSHSHIDRIAKDWFMGDLPRDVCVLVDQLLGLPDRQAVVNLSDEWTFVPDSQYDPAMDIPEWASGEGVHTSGHAACIVVYNGNWLTCWLLEK